MSICGIVYLQSTCCFGDWGRGRSRCCLLLEELLGQGVNFAGEVVELDELLGGGGHFLELAVEPASAIIYLMSLYTPISLLRACCR